MKTPELGWHEESPNDALHFSPHDIFVAGEKHHAIANTAWPIGHKTTLKDYKVRLENMQAFAIESWSQVAEMCLYVHIPFCEKICNFCEYCVVAPEIRKQQEEKYFQGLAKEMEMYRTLTGTHLKTLLGFDIGGGTPSCVDTRYIADIMNRVHRNFRLAENMNISIETTPKIAAEDPEKIKEYFAMGIRRISMGVQSVATEQIGRESTSVKWNMQARDSIRNAGFEQFNIDIMYGFAGQNIRHVRQTIEHVLSLDPEFITVYRMRYKRTNVEEKAKGVNPEDVLQQYEYIKNALAAAGYEVRNGKNTFSKVPGNDGLSDYLHHRVERAIPYLGVGLGAQSFQPQNLLSYNSGAALKHPFPYLKKIENGELPLESIHHLSQKAAMAKMISVSFYSGGIHLESFKKVFGVSLEMAFPSEIQFIRENNLMEYVANYGTLQLTEKGNRYFSGVVALFYNSEVKKYLLGLEENDWMGGKGKRERPKIQK